MDLSINSLSFTRFRNYESFSLEDLGPLSIFIGRNAVGKTNVLEGIHLLTSTSSFRRPQISQLIFEGSSQALLKMEASDESRLISTSLHLEEGKKRFAVNGKARQAADVRGILPSVAFTPDDLELAKKSSGVKRDALDALGAQLSKNYFILHRDYEKALRYKNKLLKEEASPLLVEAMNETFSTCATQLFCYRKALFSRMMPIVSKAYEAISGTDEPFEASYLPSWDHLAGKPSSQRQYSKEEVSDLISRSLHENGEEERLRRRSLVGPHNDKITFALAGKDSSGFASQGQQRSIVLAWKLAEVEMVKQTVGTNPVLLLDDVMSELDESRRDLLIKQVDGAVQTFITATDLSPFGEDLLDMARVVKLGKER